LEPMLIAWDPCGALYFLDLPLKELLNDGFLG